MSHYDFKLAQSLASSSCPSRRAAFFLFFSMATPAEQECLSQIFRSEASEFNARQAMPEGMLPDEARSLPAGNILRRTFEVKGLLSPKSIPGKK